MASGLPLRRWATPLTLGVFLLMAGTGIVMFFDWEPGLTTVVHQWMSWLFLIAAGAHVAVNFRPFRSHLKSAWGRGSLLAFGVVLGLSFFPWGMVTGPQMKDGIEHALASAPLAALAAVVEVPPAEMTGRFAAHGWPAEPEESILDLAARHGVDENLLLALVFMPELLPAPPG